MSLWRRSLNARLAARSLFVAAVSGACILPPPVSIERGVNQRPVVITEQVKPSESLVELNLNCDECTFTLPVDDPDANDTVHTRWFLDYEEGNPDFIAERSAGPAGGGRRTELTLAIDLTGRLAAPNFEGTTHTLDVVLSDQEFTDDSRGVPANAGVAVYHWTVMLAHRGTRCDDVQNICTIKTAR